MDTELAEKIIVILEDEPERWDQTVWFHSPDASVVTKTDSDSFPHGTVACVAGLVAMLKAPSGTQFHSKDLILPDDEKITYFEYATIQLELLTDHGLYLFDEGRTKEQIVEYLRADEYGQDAIFREWDEHRWPA